MTLHPLNKVYVDEMICYRYPHYCSHQQYRYYHADRCSGMSNFVKTFGSLVNGNTCGQLSEPPTTWVSAEVLSSLSALMPKHSLSSRDLAVHLCKKLPTNVDIIWALPFHLLYETLLVTKIRNDISQHVHKREHTGVVDIFQSVLDNQVKLLCKTSDAIERFLGPQFISKESRENNVVSGHASSTVG